MFFQSDYINKNVEKDSIKIELSEQSARVDLYKFKKNMTEKDYFDVKISNPKCKNGDIVLVSIQNYNSTNPVMIYPTVIHINDGFFYIRFKNLTNLTSEISNFSFYYLLV